MDTYTIFAFISVLEVQKLLHFILVRNNASYGPQSFQMEL